MTRNSINKFLTILVFMPLNSLCQMDSLVIERSQEDYVTHIIKCTFVSDSVLKVESTILEKNEGISYQLRDSIYRTPCGFISNTDSRYFMGDKDSAWKAYSRVEFGNNYNKQIKIDKTTGFLTRYTYDDLGRVIVQDYYEDTIKISRTESLYSDDSICHTFTSIRDPSYKQIILFNEEKYVLRKSSLNEHETCYYFHLSGKNIQIREKNFFEEEMNFLCSYSLNKTGYLVHLDVKYIFSGDEKYRSSHSKIDQFIQDTNSRPNIYKRFAQPLNSYINSISIPCDVQGNGANVYVIGTE